MNHLNFINAYYSSLATMKIKRFCQLYVRCSESRHLLTRWFVWRANRSLNTLCRWSNLEVHIYFAVHQDWGYPQYYRIVSSYFLLSNCTFIFLREFRSKFLKNPETEKVKNISFLYFKDWVSHLLTEFWSEKQVASATVFHHIRPASIISLGGLSSKGHST